MLNASPRQRTPFVITGAAGRYEFGIQRGRSRSSASKKAGRMYSGSWGTTFCDTPKRIVCRDALNKTNGFVSSSHPNKS